MSEFPKARNPLEGVTIKRPEAADPELRGFGNPDDEAAGRLIVTYEEMLAAKAAAESDVTKPSPPCNETQAVTSQAATCNETPSVDVTKPGGRPAKGDPPHYFLRQHSQKPPQKPAI
jgi:hypothetical protein